METVKAGTTRVELLKLFTEEGGLQNPSERTYVYCHCPSIKSMLKFAPSSNQNGVTQTTWSKPHILTLRGGRDNPMQQPAARTAAGTNFETTKALTEQLDNVINRRE